jgi:fatty acid desaturase
MTYGTLRVSALSPALARGRRPVTVTAAILLDWLCILTMFLVVARHRSWPYVFAGVLVIGIEQHVLGPWMHEGVHWLIAKNRPLNDVIVMLRSRPRVGRQHDFRRTVSRLHRIVVRT